MVQNFPTLSLAQVYGAIAFYLNHPEETEDYLRGLQAAWAELERNAEPPSGELQQRLDAVRHRRLAKQA
jgi:hypothetical protein